MSTAQVGGQITGLCGHGREYVNTAIEATAGASEMGAQDRAENKEDKEGH